MRCYTALLIYCCLGANAFVQDGNGTITCPTEVIFDSANEGLNLRPCNDAVCNAYCYKLVLEGECCFAGLSDVKKCCCSSPFLEGTCHNEGHCRTTNGQRVEIHQSREYEVTMIEVTEVDAHWIFPDFKVTMRTRNCTNRGQPWYQPTLQCVDMTSLYLPSLERNITVGLQGVNCQSDGSTPVIVEVDGEGQTFNAANPVVVNGTLTYDEPYAYSIEITAVGACGFSIRTSWAVVVLQMENGMGLQWLMSEYLCDVGARGAIVGSCWDYDTTIPILTFPSGGEMSVEQGVGWQRVWELTKPFVKSYTTRLEESDLRQRIVQQYLHMSVEELKEQTIATEVFVSLSYDFCLHLCVSGRNGTCHAAEYDSPEAIPFSYHPVGTCTLYTLSKPIPNICSPDETTVVVIDNLGNAKESGYIDDLLESTFMTSTTNSHCLELTTYYAHIVSNSSYHFIDEYDYEDHMDGKSRDQVPHGGACYVCKSGFSAEEWRTVERCRRKCIEDDSCDHVSVQDDIGCTIETKAPITDVSICPDNTRAIVVMNNLSTFNEYEKRHECASFRSGPLGVGIGPIDEGNECLVCICECAMYQDQYVNTYCKCDYEPFRDYTFCTFPYDVEPPENYEPKRNCVHGGVPEPLLVEDPLCDDLETFEDLCEDIMGADGAMDAAVAEHALGEDLVAMVRQRMEISLETCIFDMCAMEGVEGVDVFQLAQLNAIALQQTIQVMTGIKLDVDLATIDDRLEHPCPENAHYEQCARPQCQPVCSTNGAPPECNEQPDAGECLPGCVCDEGYGYEDVNGPACVKLCDDGSKPPFAKNNNSDLSRNEFDFDVSAEIAKISDQKAIPRSVVMIKRITRLIARGKEFRSLRKSMTIASQICLRTFRIIDAYEYMDAEILKFIAVANEVPDFIDFNTLKRTAVLVKSISSKELKLKEHEIMSYSTSVALEVLFQAYDSMATYFNDIDFTSQVSLSESTQLRYDRLILAGKCESPDLVGSLFATVLETISEFTMATFANFADEMPDFAKVQDEKLRKKIPKKQRKQSSGSGSGT